MSKGRQLVKAKEPSWRTRPRESVPAWSMCSHRRTTTPGRAPVPCPDAGTMLTRSRVSILPPRAPAAPSPALATDPSLSLFPVSSNVAFPAPELIPRPPPSPAFPLDPALFTDPALYPASAPARPLLGVLAPVRPTTSTSDLDRAGALSCSAPPRLPVALVAAVAWWWRDGRCLSSVTPLPCAVGVMCTMTSWSGRSTAGSEVSCVMVAVATTSPRCTVRPGPARGVLLGGGAPALTLDSSRPVPARPAPPREFVGAS
ncbi:hypothetical protein E2C01_070860 [Portunus trituberculatus]|uniref:Uncharacterized protein n=1 Tax=Portunus trituberculatus TaxID=210409 RepID=A0A5B7I3P2_PORTR|nr:hypothetical protein [Portunus trituberculatus]